MKMLFQRPLIHLVCQITEKSLFSGSHLRISSVYLKSKVY